MSYALGSITNISTLLTNAKEELGLRNTTDSDFFLRRLLTEGAKEIFSMDCTVQKQVILDRCEKTFKVPCEFLMFNKGYGIRFVWHDQTCSEWYYPEISNNAFFKNNRNWGGWSTIQLIGEYLYLDNICEDFPPQIEISGLFIKTNEDGSMYIPEINTRPTVAYACYKFIRAMIRNPQLGYTLAQMNDFKIEWSQGKDGVTALSKMPDGNTKQVIRRLWNAQLG